MRINWKVLIAIALIAATAVWAFTSLRTQAYSGTSLDFAVGRGPVTVTNPSDAPVTVQLAGTGSRSFTVASTTEGVAGSSTREGTGRSVPQLFTLVLPAGTTAFTVSNGTAVQFRSDGDVRLGATVQPVSAGDTQTTLIAAAVVILGSLFYLWRATGHRGMRASRRQRTEELFASQTAANAATAPSQGNAIRSYGDNRASSSS